MQGKFKGLKKFCENNGISYEWAVSKTRHKAVKDFDELQARWLAVSNGGNTETPPVNVTTGLSDEQLQAYDLESLRMIKIQQEIKHKELASEKIRVSIQKERAELIPFTALVDLLGTVAALTRIQVSSLISSLPAKLEGLPADKLTIIIRDEIERILQELSENIGNKLDELQNQ